MNKLLLVLAPAAVALGLYSTCALSLQSLKVEKSRKPAAARQLSCERKMGSLPNPNFEPGTPNPKIPIGTIVVVMQENHSFDNYFGRLNQQEYYGDEIDGVREHMFNLDVDDRKHHVTHSENLCLPDPEHDWEKMHNSWSQGTLAGFVKTNGPVAMAYYDQRELPYYYALANTFATADRYFSSVLGPTYPNRYFMYAATAFGNTTNEEPKKPSEFSQRTIFDVLTYYGITWKYYSDWTYMNGSGYISLFSSVRRREDIETENTKLPAHFATIDDYHRDAAAGDLPEVVFLDSMFDKEDEHPEANVQVGQAWTAGVIRSLMKSPQWDNSVLFLTYDEAGGFYDHVAPPLACLPDNIRPIKDVEDFGGFDHYGFRVPFVVVSPFAKRHYVSHEIHDHTSILKFIETKFNLPALTRRDANADALDDFFQFDRPDFSIPELPLGRVDPNGVCEKRH